MCKIWPIARNLKFLSYGAWEFLLVTEFWTIVIFLVHTLCTYLFLFTLESKIMNKNKPIFSFFIHSIDKRLFFFLVHSQRLIKKTAQALKHNIKEILIFCQTFMKPVQSNKSMGHLIWPNFMKIWQKIRIFLIYGMF